MLVNHKRVARMMREDNLLAVQPRAFVVTTDSDHELEVYLNLASRMKLTGINQLWVADITYIRLQREFVYLAVILDAFSRKVVGWELDRTLAARLPIAALEKAIAERQAAARPGASLRSRRAVCLRRLRADPAEAQHDPEHEPAGESIRQRQLRELHEDSQAGGDLRQRVSRSRSPARQHRGVHRAATTIACGCIRRWATGRRRSSSRPPTPATTSQGATMSFFRHEEIYRSDVGS